MEVTKAVMGTRVRETRELVITRFTLMDKREDEKRILCWFGFG